MVRSWSRIPPLGGETIESGFFYRRNPWSRCGQEHLTWSFLGWLF